jgi:hypothetical protein
VPGEGGDGGDIYRVIYAGQGAGANAIHRTRAELRPATARAEVYGAPTGIWHHFIVAG